MAAPKQFEPQDREKQLIENAVRIAADVVEACGGAPFTAHTDEDGRQHRRGEALQSSCQRFANAPPRPDANRRKCLTHLVGENPAEYVLP